MCADPDSYVFWDTNGHLTAPANLILGQGMVNAIPEPEILGLLVLGMLGFRFGPRRRAATGPG